ncbi:MAG: PIG-L family deacetylase [Gemmatimonadales bacterium]
MNPRRSACAPTLTLTLLLLFAALRAVMAQSEVRAISNSPRDYFIVAHQDDWQLFMGDIVAKGIRAGNPTTFIYLTAGDNGREDELYWRTRERAALQSTRFIADTPGATGIDPGCSDVAVLTHSIRKCVIGNSESYFLRLPDGKRNGAGFASHGHRSLRKLRGKKIATISAVDGSETYAGWDDLLSTVEALIKSSSGDGGVLMHSTDPSISANPHDHFDHRSTGRLVSDLRKKENWDARYYVGYALATRAPNRTGEETREKTSIFLAYDGEMMRANKMWGAYREHPAFYSQCMERTYGRKARRK